MNRELSVEETDSLCTSNITETPTPGVYHEFKSPMLKKKKLGAWGTSLTQRNLNSDNLGQLEGVDEDFSPVHVSNYEPKSAAKLSI